MKFVPLIGHDSKEEFYIEVTGSGCVRMVSRAHQVQQMPDGRVARGPALLNASSVMIQNFGEVIVQGNPSTVVKLLENGSGTTGVLE